MHPAREAPAPAEAVPEWAQRYDAAAYPHYAVTGDAVALALDRAGGGALRALVVVRGSDPFRGLDAWPGGFLEWEVDPTTRETALRELREETGVAEPPYLEPLGSYTQDGRDPRQFAGHRDPASGAWVRTGARVASNAYLMLMPRPARTRAQADEASDARWSDLYHYLPWEDLRADAGRRAAAEALAFLGAWAARVGGDAAARIDYAFGFGLREWNEERVGERWRLLLEAGAVAEAHRDRWGRPAGGGVGMGREMAFDHRRILADALSRVRGKIKYLPAALQALAGDEFTLDELQAACEAVAGRPLHRANFRRAVVETKQGRARAPRLVSGTGRYRRRSPREPGVAPELFRFRDDIVHARLDPSLRLPFLPVEPRVTP